MHWPLFPIANHLHCLLHYRGNIEKKLHELHFPADITLKFVHDILGNPLHQEEGLVDAHDEDELDAMTASFQDVWNHREEIFHLPPSFHSWFVKNCRNTVAKNMLRPVRENIGLGCPPEPYFTNAVESKNNVLKQQFQYKASELPVFVHHMQDLLLEQKKEIERAVTTGGEYHVALQYSDPVVASQKWFKMTEQQRLQKVHEGKCQCQPNNQCSHGNSE